ncbi:hypothetical protein ACXR2T_10700 [Leucobacter sp. HY1910]
MTEWDIFWRGYVAGEYRQRARESGDTAARARLNAWLYGVLTVVAVVVAVWSPFWWWMAALWALFTVASVFAARTARELADYWRARGDVIVNRFKEETKHD